MIKVAINGFGRIGRLTFRNLIENKNIDLVAVNDLTDNDTLAHLLKYDSAHGKLSKEVKVDGDYFQVGNDKVKAFSERDPRNLPWADLGVDVVLECTGVFRTYDKAAYHLEAGAKKVILSAPSKGGDVVTIVQGVNDDEIASNVKIYSNASCTTNCFAPMVKLLNDKWGIEHGNMTTIHAYTADQRIQDAPHRDLRRARAAAYNIVPTTTGAAKATAVVYPKIGDRIDAMAVRVPTITGSLVDFTCTLSEEVTSQDVNDLFKSASENDFKEVIEYCTDPIVSSDIVGNKHGCIFDSLLTESRGKNISIVAWYDNEAGYSARLAQLVSRI